MTQEPIKGQEEVLRYGSAAGEQPLLDTLASLALTALDDPAALGLREHRDGFEEAKAFAMNRLNDIIDALNPDLETFETFAATFTVLGRQLAERADYLEATEYEGEEAAARDDAVRLVHDALDLVDKAIERLSL